MKKILSVILNTNGIFASTLPKERTLTSQAVSYIGLNADKENIRNDAKIVYKGVKKATNDAKTKLKM
jgi:hypothetical protein